MAKVLNNLQWRNKDGTWEIPNPPLAYDQNYNDDWFLAFHREYDYDEENFDIADLRWVKSANPVQQLIYYFDTGTQGVTPKVGFCMQGSNLFAQNWQYVLTDLSMWLLQNGYIIANTNTYTTNDRFYPVNGAYNEFKLNDNKAFGIIGICGCWLYSSNIYLISSEWRVYELAGSADKLLTIVNL